ncbi:uncharacterized protein K02A2.6-like [Carassius carassius]|uniref:uncharacterized protein K02A2.6-like n=1 Tax=Carassius carassius TaxID=217509 RepID=UPI002868E2E7|nr:uncharacterized protein K02A2.6-like [Carassius carassius]
MAAIIGHVEAFEEAREQWSTYVERFGHFVEANDISNEKKVSVFLSVMGAPTYGLLRSLIAPAKPGAMDYNDIVSTLQAHFTPKPIVIAERFRFHKRNQAEGESIAQYVAVLKRLAENCEFGDNLNDALRDRLVCGLSSESIQRKLLTEMTLTYQKAVDIAMSMEAVSRESQHLSNALKVNAMSLSSASSREKCYRCGKSNHMESECFYKEQQCHNCARRGHISRMCKSKKMGDKGPKTAVKGKFMKNKDQMKKRRIHKMDVNVESDDDTTSDTDAELTLHKVTAVLDDTSRVNKIEGLPIDMEVDTGAAVSLISSELYRAKLSHIRLRHTSIVLKTYTGEVISPEGVIKVRVKLNKQSARLPLYVVKGDTAPLFGREWLRRIRLNWREIKTVRAVHQTNEKTLDSLLKKYAKVFSDDLGTFNGFEATLNLKPGHQPKFFQARVVPYAIRPKVEAELDRLVKQGIISPVRFSEWATPIVPVVKKGGNVRICGDFKITVNPALCVEHYPLPRIEDLFASLAGGQRFSKLDLSHAYLQVPVNVNSRKYLTITTHKGMFSYNRLPFGITSAPSIFQRGMEQVLQGLPYVHCFLDDILVTGKDDVHHLANLEAVLSRLEKFGLRVKPEKSEFFKSSLEYLGHVIDAAGLHKSPDKLRAIAEAPVPVNVSQLRSFLGLINYYARFVPNLATILQPLNAMLHKDIKWNWAPECEKSFQGAKAKLLTPSVLTHYDQRLPVRLACDASPYGVGAVLSHVMPDGQERPIAFASRTLSKSEQNYAQLEREALGIIFGVRKFHTYLYGRHFTLLTDHRPLTTILSPSKATPSMAAARLQRWALLLAAHNYTIQYKSGSDHGNADGLSRLPLPVLHKDKKDSVDTYLINHVEALPVCSADIRKGTRADPVLSRVVEMVSSGQFPSTKDSDNALTPFIIRKGELSLMQDCLMWGQRVIVPPNLRQRVLEDLHVGHPGVVKMKALARSYIWWPSIDSQIEEKSKTCLSCQKNQKSPCLSPLHPWPWPGAPWQRIHIDFAGPFEGRMFLVVVDAHSKWPEVHVMDSTTSSKTIQVLRGLFSRYGIPETLVSDNGPQLTSDEFGSFLKANGVKHVRSAPFHPATNGLAERFVQTFKRSLKAYKEPISLQQRLDAFLLQYRNTPHSTTRETPAMLFLHRRLRTRLDLLKPSVANVVDQAQKTQCSYRSVHSKHREFDVGDSVLVRDYRRGEEKWKTGTVSSQTGPVSYTVEVGNLQIWKRHTDQMLGCHPEISEATELPQSVDIPPQIPDNAGQQLSSPVSETNMGASDQGETKLSELSNISSQGVRRFPVRVRKPPNRLNL